MTYEPDETLEMVSRMGYRPRHLDIVKIARSRVGKTLYKRGAKRHEWPRRLDCSALTKWAYGRLGIWLPRYSIDQCAEGRPVGIRDLKAGDLVFTKGFRNYYWNDPKEGVGHVAMMTSANSVIEAANSTVNIRELPWDQFAKQHLVVQCRRIVEDFRSLCILLMSDKLLVESSYELRWKILQNQRKPPY